MEVLFTPEIEAKLARSAAQQSRNPGELVQQAVARYFDEESRFIDAVNRGENALLRGEYLTHEQVGRDMANVETDLEIDWTACELIEKVPGKVSGRPIVRGTRILPDGIVNSYDMGESIDEIREDWPSLSATQINRLIEFAHSQRGQAHP